MNKLSRILLYPFSLIYGLLISTRNVFYDTGLLRETNFSLPVISIGNLSVGGAGKTPHVEYLIHLLDPYINVSVLSRGYKRKTKGFRMIQRNDNALVAGDEPLQYKRKFQQVPVAVSESRALGIPQLIKREPAIQCVLLDDAFQHRSVKPFVNILLTPYQDLYVDDNLLPSGRLRENIDSAKRADLIIVSKCPEDINLEDAQQIKNKLKPTEKQEVYFSQYSYQAPYHILNGRNRIKLNPSFNIILISAIASTSYLMQYLNENSNSINSLEYEDHHLFTDRDMNYLKRVYAESEKENTIILTTEKDAIRLQQHSKFIIDNNLPIFALPVRVKFLFDHGKSFDQLLMDLLLEFSV